MRGLGTVVRKEFLELWGASTKQWASKVMLVLGPVLVMLIALMMYVGDPFAWEWGALVFLPGMFTFAMMIFTAESFAGERERHTLESLLAAPVNEHTILAGKVLAHMMMGIATGLVALFLLWVVVLPVDGGAVTASPRAVLYSLLLVFHLFLLSETIGVFVGQRASTVAGANAIIMPLLMVPWMALVLLPSFAQELATTQAFARLDLLAANVVVWVVLVSYACALLAVPFILHRNKAHRLLDGRS